VTHVSTALAGQVALETSELGTRSLLPANGAEVTPSRALEIIPADLPSSNHAPNLPTLGLPLFLYCSFRQIIFFAYLSMTT
jgi:hypothetical protein